MDNLQSNIIKMLRNRSLTKKKVEYNVEKSNKCIICRQILTSDMKTFCKSCGYAAFNNPLYNENYSSELLGDY